MQAVPSRKQLQTELAVFIKPSTAKEVILFVIDVSMYLLAIALVLASSSWILKLVGGILAGIKMANLSTLDHDAVHNSLTRSKTSTSILPSSDLPPACLTMHCGRFLPFVSKI
jgi:omega-6 fatty acid desaturase (delta-12 desaturase)